MKNFHFIYVLAFFFSFIGNAQDMEIKGVVKDTNIFQPVYNAKVYLINISDSVIVGYQNTSSDGSFHFQVPISNYRFFISHPSYNTKEMLFVGTEENHFFDLGEIILDEESIAFEEIAVYAYKDPMYYRGDTLVYLADSFATQSNAVVEDLLKQLPGIAVESDGSITSQGKTISKVYVDGDEFFGSDPTIATKNLSAKSIDRVQVYEMDPEDGAIGDEKIQILDLRLKENAKKGWFLKANGASDFQKFHEGQLLFNRFNNKQKIFAFGLGSNTLNSSISREDAQMAGMGGSGNIGGGNASNGYPQTFRAGVLFSQQVNEKLKFSGDYLFSDNRVTSESERNTQYLLSDTTYFSDNLTNKKTRNQTHDLSLNFKIDIDSTQTLTIAPRVSYSLSGNESQQETDYNDANSSAVRQAVNKSENSANGFSINNRLHYRKRFAKDHRSLILSDNLSYSNNQSENQMNYFDYFYLTELTDNEILQLKENSTINFTNTFMARFTEPLSEEWRLNFDYELYNNSNNQDKYSYDYDGEAFSILDSLTSNVFRTTRWQNKFGISTTYSTRSHNLSIGVRGRNLLVENENLFTDLNIKQNEFSALPFLHYRYRISQNSSFVTRISTNSSLPSISYLSPARDNTNPNNVLEGNEDLRSNYNVSANMNYLLFKPVSEFNFIAGLSARYTFNDFARSVNYDSLGRSISIYENINTFNNISGRMEATVPVFKRNLRINPRIVYTNSNQNNIVDGVNNLTNIHNFTPELRLIVLNKWVDFTTSVRLTEQIGNNSTNANMNIRNTIWNFNNDLTIFLPWKIDVKMTGNYYNYSNLSQAFNKNFFIMNASISKRFGKYDDWTVGVEGYDLLNENTNINRTFTANTIVDSRNDIISRYFLFRVTYSFNSTFRVKPEQDEGF